MHSRCTVIASLTSRTDLAHHAWLKNHGAHCLCLSQNSHTPSHNVVRHTSLDDTEHGHSFLTYPESFPQRAQTLRRSTASAEWRFGWSPTRCTERWKSGELLFLTWFSIALYVIVLAKSRGGFLPSCSEERNEFPQRMPLALCVALGFSMRSVDLQNRMNLKFCGQHSIWVVDECRTAAPETSNELW